MREVSPLTNTRCLEPVTVVVRLPMTGKKAKKAKAAEVAAESGQSSKAPEPASNDAPVVCLACKSRPERVAWADGVKRGSIDVPKGNRCLSCHKLWQRCFNYLQWPQFGKLMQSEDSVGCSCGGGAWVVLTWIPSRLTLNQGVKEKRKICLSEKLSLCLSG